MPKPTAFEIRVALLNRGYSISAWARARGYEPVTVHRVITRWTQPRPRLIPHGATTVSILADLTRDLGRTIVTGITPSDPDPDPGREAA